MRIKKKTPGDYPGASKTCHSRGARQVQYPTKTTKNQAVPVPGTALTAFLKRYKHDLLQLECSREVSRIVENVDQLLIMAEGGGHVR